MRRHTAWRAGLLMIALCSIGALGVSDTFANTATASDAYAISVPSKIPSSVVSVLQHRSDIPVVLPAGLPTFQAPMPSGFSLAVNLDISSGGYGLDFFWRQKNSHTAAFPNANFVGTISGTKNKAEALNGAPWPDLSETLSQSKHRKSVTLRDGTRVTEYIPSSVGIDAIAWSRKGWTFETSGLANQYTPATTIGMANAIADYAAKHGVIVPGAKRGYVEAAWLGNSPDFNVVWTYNSKIWYSVSMRTLFATLAVAHASALITQHDPHVKAPRHAAIQSVVNPSYILALNTADQFLIAWMQRDWAAGSSLLTPSELRKHSKSYLQEYFIGLSDPHHESFEITFDKWINPRHRLLYKRILEELPCAQSM